MLHKMFHLMETLDFPICTEFQNPKKLQENWQNYNPLMTDFNVARHIVTEILGSESLHVQLIVNTLD